MENILAAMDPAETHFYAGVHALNLAKRIEAKVLFLLVYPPSTKRSARSRENKDEASVKTRLAALIEEARSDGITVEYYVVHGRFEKELVSFVQANKITLLVIESSAKRDSINGAKAFLDKIRHRIDCRIEVVNEKPETSERKE
jgi:nucleotide-binding universal stress UspA family protein